MTVIIGIFAAMGVFVGLTGFLLLLSAWNAWWTLSLWNGFMAPLLSLPTLTFGQWALFVFVIGFLTHQYQRDAKESEPLHNTYVAIVVKGPLAYGAFRLTAWWFGVQL